MLKSTKLAVAFAAAIALTAAAPEAHAQFVVPEVTVNIAPPPPQVEVQTVAPAPGYTWIAGHWAWRYGRHEWIRGHWAQAPQSGMVWENARWINRGGNWVFLEGHWRWAAPPAQVVYDPPQVQTQPVYVQAPPPPVINEVRTASPWANAVWIPGYWHWNGYNHMWVAGRWSAPRVGWRWESDRSV